jgi:hypothetical protein
MHTVYTFYFYFTIQKQWKKQFLYAIIAELRQQEGKQQCTFATILVKTMVAKMWEI